MDILQQCLPRYTSFNYPTGCSLTAASVDTLTPDAYEALLGDKELTPWFTSALDAKLAGYQETTLDMLLQGRFKSITGELSQIKVSKQSGIAPFIRRNQKTVLNDTYFTVTAGTAGSSNAPAGTWVVTVKSHAEIEKIAATFMPGMYINVDSDKSVGSITVPSRTVFKVVSAVDNVVAPGATPTANVTVVPVSASGEDNEPVNGLVVLLANNVGDHQKWAYNPSTYNNKKQIAFWLQTSRKTFTTNDEYDNFIKRVMAGEINDAFAFRALDVAEQRRQVEVIHRKAWYNSIFFGDVISDKQTEGTYTELPTETNEIDNAVYDGRTFNDCVLAYKANALGIMTQLRNCDRIQNLAGEDLDLNEFMETLYEIKRNRAGEGAEINDIDVVTDRFTAARFRRAFNVYLKNQGISLNVQLGDTQSIYQGTKTKVAGSLTADTYYLPEASVTINVIHNLFTDDFVAASARAGLTRRFIWILDWSDITVGLAGSNSAVRETPDAKVNPYARDVLKYIKEKTVLDSTTWTVILERPKNHFVWNNFGDGIVVTKADGTVETVK